MARGGLWARARDNRDNRDNRDGRGLFPLERGRGGE